MKNALTIDVEDYWSVFSRDWLDTDVDPCDAVVRNTEWFVDTLANHNVKATFFVLGEVAQKYPGLIKHIVEQGHEIGVHGFRHRQIFKLAPQEFATEVRNAKELLEDIASAAVIGHRAPAFSLNPETFWALEVLAELGFKYDSSVSPLAARRYGWPGFSKDICVINLPSGTRFVEAPISTVSLLGKEFNVGGGFLRCFPYFMTKYALRHLPKMRPGVIYVHPYEIDAEQVKFDTTNLSKLQRKRAIAFHRRQLLNRATVKKKVKRLLQDFEFVTLGEVIEQSVGS